MVRSGADPVIRLGWFVCPTVSRVTTGRATRLEKTLYHYIDEIIDNIILKEKKKKFASYKLL